VFIWATTIGFADIRITRAHSLVDDCIDILLYYASFRVRIKAGFVREANPAYVIHGKKGSFLKLVAMFRGRIKIRKNQI
jgi:hypothetical protein